MYNYGLIFLKKYLNCLQKDIFQVENRFQINGNGLNGLIYTHLLFSQKSVVKIIKTFFNHQ